MNLTGHELRVIAECELLQIGQVVYCIKDCPEKRIFMVWTEKLVFGVNQIKLPYARRECFKII